MPSYELIRLIPSGDVYAVRLTSDGRALACGPLHHSETAGPLSDMNYDDEIDRDAYEHHARYGASTEHPGDVYRILRTEQ